MDVVEIGAATQEMGAVIQIKALGVLSMIDDGELDWKLIAIAANDEHAASINDVDDIEKFYPGTVSGIREWFRWQDAGRQACQRLRPSARPAADAKAIAETHAHYKAAAAGTADKGKLWFP